MEKEWAFYELYKIDWCEQRNISLKDAIANKENGINGEMYVCFDEFMDNEYQDKEYMDYLYHEYWGGYDV